jgi:putative membrane protein
MMEAIGVMDGTMGGCGGMMLLWGLIAVLLLALLVVGLVWMLRSMSGAVAGRSATTARQELDVRYARGELTSEEYQQRRADLEGPEA